ncbi:2'-5' RNA ligase family protein [Clostridium senegalense]|uniref:2'-5' RNA ligase family protein n=1 Tax=Clostridium senegalense TaxID=1465809 RepID=A0A6M0H2Y0_9CLOT|nr:2'-5' RNA ligase family protein [Clostridium senegalense]NEU04969.1 hypothetical protein [Clostridium senegalense]
MPKEYEKKVRDRCNIYNCNIGLDDVTFSLPQHISLKISFQCKEYLNAIKIIENMLSGMGPLAVDVIGINRIPSIIWLTIKENEKLKSIHDDLDEALLYNLNIYQHEFDKDFKFHSTLYLDKNEEKLTEIFNLLNEEEFNDKLVINSYAIGVSEDGKPGTFKIIKIIK